MFRRFYCLQVATARAVAEAAREGRRLSDAIVDTAAKNKKQGGGQGGSAKSNKNNKRGVSSASRRGSRK